MPGTFSVCRFVTSVQSNLWRWQVQLFEQRAAKIILVHFFITGIVYWSDIYYLPLYYQNVRGYSPLMSGVMILPLVVAFSIGSSTSGIIISRVGKCNGVLRMGYILWAAGAGGRIALHRTSHIAVMVVVQIIEGIGIGFCFQPGLFPVFKREGRLLILMIRNDCLFGKFSQGRPCCSHRPSEFLENRWRRSWFSWYLPPCF